MDHGDSRVLKALILKKNKQTERCTCISRVSGAYYRAPPPPIALTTEIIINSVQQGNSTA